MHVHGRLGWGLAGLVLLVVLSGGCTSTAEGESAPQTPTASDAVVVSEEALPSEDTVPSDTLPSEDPVEDTVAAVPSAPDTPQPSDEGALLYVVDEKDGDSFVASDGVEYRVGMVNAPERSQCGGAEASRRAHELMRSGFTAEAYAADDYGRQVARVHTSTGDLGVLMAREGLVDDRYLEQFRHQHPAYAAELDAAFEEARSAAAGLWQTCWAPPAESRGGAVEPATGHTGRTGQWACHPAYRECLPNGPDLDCREVGHTVELLGNADPFRLDGNSTTATDGWGCDTYPAWSPTERYPYYVG